MKSFLTYPFGVLMMACLVLAGCRNEDNLIEPTCFDEVRNQGEVRVDCGGPNCPFCEPSCDDFEENQDEISAVTPFNPNVRGIDCGGANCEPCSTCEDGIRNAHWVRDFNITPEEFMAGGDSIALGANGFYYRLLLEPGIDCGFPCPMVCAPTCFDGLWNGTEQGIDCGAVCPDSPPCNPTCNDGVQNGNETGIDCGDAVLEESVCGLCPPPTCSDGIQNIHIEITDMVPAGYLVVYETGIDCDNNQLTTCPDCPVATCWDGVQNGSETGIDCGGNCVTLCDTTASCGNGYIDGDELGIDCDLDPATPCPPCPTCSDLILNGPEFDVDCTDYLIPGSGCEVCPSCHDDLETVEQFELDVDCSGIGEGCEPCMQELTAGGIGTSGSPFRDQYSFNRLLALSGNTDTLSLNHAAYPGLKVEKVTGAFGINHLRITANQGFETGSNGLFIRTVIAFIPIPSENNLGAANAINMLNGMPPQFGLCIPVPIDNVPFVIYKEILVDNPALVDKCFLSYVAAGENSTLTFDYLRGYAQTMSYSQGNINQGSMRRAQLLGGFEQGSYTDIQWKVLYSFFP